MPQQYTPTCHEQESFLAYFLGKPGNGQHNTQYWAGTSTDHGYMTDTPNKATKIDHQKLTFRGL